ncbi:MAG: DUF4250 domain-containing protein [Muribaculaceae bacterium]|nr:DUF4250 domain-containing protein [Muribaculaceae bacterium]
MTDPLDNLPKDPAMLMSYIDTKLRDEYPSLEALCDDMHIDISQIIQTLEKSGFEYDKTRNRVW